MREGALPESARRLLPPLQDHRRPRLARRHQLDHAPVRAGPHQVRPAAQRHTIAQRLRGRIYKSLLNAIEVSYEKP